MQEQEEPRLSQDAGESGGISIDFEDDYISVSHSTSVLGWLTSADRGSPSSCQRGPCALCVPMSLFVLF